MLSVFKLPVTVKGNSGTITVVSVGKSYTSTPTVTNVENYKDNTGSELTDGVKGVSATKWNKSICGYTSDPTIVIDLGTVTPGLFKFEARYMVIADHSAPIGSAVISVSNDNVNWTNVGSLVVPTSGTEDRFDQAVLELEDGVEGRYVKYEIMRSDTTKYLCIDELTVSAKKDSSCNITLEAEGATLDDVMLTGGGKVENGTTMTIIAAVKAGKNYVFDKWTDGSGNTVSKDPAYSFTVSGNATYKAVFKTLPQYTVTASSNDTLLGTVTVNGATYSGGTYNYGDSITLKAEPTGSNIFVCWQENGRLVSESDTYTFNVKGTHNICAYFVRAGEYPVIFKDEGGQILKIESVENGKSASAPTNTSKVGYKFAGWDKTFNTITGKTEVIALYNPGATYSVSVKNGTIAGGGTSGNYNFDTLITVQASNSTNFSYWKASWNDGSSKIVSYDTVYSFYVSDNIVLEAVSNDNRTKMPIATINGTIKGDGSVSFVAQCIIPWSLKTTYTIEEYGVLLSQDNTNPDLNDSKAIRGRAGSMTPDTGQFIITKVNASGQTWYGRAYLVYKDADGNLYTVYSDVKSITGQ